MYVCKIQCCGTRNGNFARNKARQGEEGAVRTNPAWRIKGRTSDGPARQDAKLVFDTGRCAPDRQQGETSECLGRHGRGAMANKKVRNGDVPSSSKQLNGPVINEPSYGKLSSKQSAS